MNNQDNYTYEEILELTKQGIEIWRRVVIDDIVFDYEVSNLGRIKSLKSNLGGCERIGYGSKSYGYMRKILCYTDENGDKKYKAYLIHRLVAIMFIPNLSNKPFVDHLDTNKTNNRVDNLSWVTHQENMNNNTTKNNISKGQKRKSRRELSDEEKYPYVTKEDILAEKWKPIKDYEGLYEISDMGRIRGLGFKGNYKRAKRRKEGLLQPSINKNGYQEVLLTDRNSNKKKCLVHQLVAKHFIDNPNDYKVVDHKNANRADNRHFNLRWVTYKENMNNDKTIKNLSRPVIVLDKNGDILSNGLGVYETAEYIGINKKTFLRLLKSNEPYRVNVTNDTDQLRLLNGMRIYYIDEYNKEETMREITEDKTNYSYCTGDLVCVYANGSTTEPMNGTKLAKELGIGECLLRRIKKSKEPYKMPKHGVSKEYLEHLKTLENIRIMYYEDYLKEQEPIR